MAVRAAVISLDPLERKAWLDRVLLKLTIEPPETGVAPHATPPPPRPTRPARSGP